MIPSSGCLPWRPDHPRTRPRTGTPTPPRGARPPKAAMHAPHYEIEARQHVIGVIERAVGQNVGFDAFEDPELPRKVRVQLVREHMLSIDLLDREPTSVVSAPRAVGHPEVRVAPRTGG